MKTTGEGKIMMKTAEHRNLSTYGSRAGFTLIEVMLVVVILGILATIAVVATRGRTTEASIAATRATIGGVATALDAFEVDNGTYPNSLNELVNDTGNATWRGPYLRSGRLPADAWAGQLTYSKSNNGYKLVSAGPDKQFGSGDDITN
jgi:general secretion pathway protein G